MGKGARLRDSHSQELAHHRSPEPGVTHIEQSYQGPIPTASEFGRYEDVLPGAADRILKMSESALKAEIKGGYIDRFGMLLSLILNKGFLYTLLFVSLYLIMNDKPIEALLTGIAPIVATFNSIFRRKK